MNNLNLVIQTLEVTNQAILCVNMIDETTKNGITIDIDKLSNDKIVEIGVVNNGVVNEVNREYIKFNGDFTDWSKKKEFIEGNTTNK